MTKEQFDKYQFSINTQVCVIKDRWGKLWDKIDEVNFEDRTIAIKRGQIYKYNEILEIK